MWAEFDGVVCKARAGRPRRQHALARFAQLGTDVLYEAEGSRVADNLLKEWKMACAEGAKPWYDLESNQTCPEVVA